MALGKFLTQSAVQDSINTVAGAAAGRQLGRNGPGVPPPILVNELLLMELTCHPLRPLSAWPAERDK